MNNDFTLRNLCNRLLYALLALVVVVVVMRTFGTQSLAVTPFGITLGAIVLVAGTNYLFSIYRLSKRMSQSSSTAWLMLFLQIIPIIGIPAAIALLLKANAAAAAQEREHASLPGGQREA